MPEISTYPGSQEGLPPVNLPSLDLPRQPLRITVGSKPPPKSADPYEGFTPYEPKQEVAAQGDPYAGFTEYMGPKEPPREKPFGLGDTWPARIAKAAWSAAKLPGDVYQGKVDPLSEEAIGRAAELATFASPMSVARQAPKAALPAVLSPGQKAASTAEALGAPLPRGLASDRPFVQATTSAARQIPWAGQKITQRAGETVKAAGGKIGEITEELAPSVDRAAADAAIRPAIENVVKANKGRIDDAYTQLRSEINPDQRFAMPDTERALKQIELERSRAGWTNPRQGLEQAWQVVKEGGGFNGTHRLRMDMREAGGQFGVPHPGYNKADFKRVTAAVTADMRANVRKASSDPNRAESLLNTAELTAGQHIAENKLLQQLINAKGEGAISRLLSAGKEKGGNVRLLGQLRNSMKPEDFAQISGTMLHELGHSNATNVFSLSKFVTEWDKLAPEAKNVLFSKDHRKWIDDVAQLGKHLKDADKFVNTSNTAGALILFEIMKTAGEVGAGVAMGVVSPMAGAMTAVGGLGAYALTRFLAQPAKAAAMSAWVKAYRAVSLGAPTPARLGVFVAANRNLAHNLGLAPEQVLRIVQQSGQPANAQSQPQP